MESIKRVLLATDYSPASERARDHAAVIASVLNAELHVLYVQVLLEDSYGAGGYPGYEAYEQAIREQADSHHAGYVKALRMPIVAATERDVSGSAAIVRYANEHDIDLIVVGTHSRKGVSRLFLGSVASEVIRNAPCSVLTVGPRHHMHENPFGVILVAVDFSQSSYEALRRAGQWAHQFDAHLVVMHVVDTSMLPPYYPRLFEDRQREGARQALGDMLDAAAVTREVTPVITMGNSYDCIVEQAQEHNADLIVMGTQGLRGLRKLMIGSVTERVLRQAPCPVLACRSSHVQAEAG